VTIVDGDKATVTKSDLAGKSLGRDVAKLENGEVVIHHFDGAGKAAGFEKVAYGADGVVTTRHYSSLNVFQGSEKMSTDADGVTTIKHYSASNVFTGAETVSTDLAGVTTTKVYDASFVMVSLQKVTPKDDGAITVQTFDRNIKMTSMDVIRTGGGATTTYHYDKNAAFTGYDVATLDDNGVTTTASYNTSYRLVETSFTGSDRADVLTGSSGVTHFHGGLGSDQLTGGGGVDYFHFDTAIGLGDVDTIANFTLGKDKIVLDLGVFQGLTSGALDPNVFVASGQALDAGDRVLFTQATGQIWYDADGTGVAAPVLIGQVSANAALTAMDFLVG
jgi:Ca2+-binding RTX toxin-like protein